MDDRTANVVIIAVVISYLSSAIVIVVPGGAIAGSFCAGQEVLVDPSKPIIYWANHDGSDLKFINASTGEIIDSIVFGSSPSSVCLDSNGTKLYVAIPSTKSIVVVDTESRAIVDNIALSFSPFSLGLDGRGYMYVSGTGDKVGWIFSVDMSTLNIKSSVWPGTLGLVIEISPAGSILLAMQVDSIPLRIYKYGIASGTFAYMAEDDLSLGLDLQEETVDWSMGKIYLASIYPRGIQAVSIDTLAALREYPMDPYLYPSCVALSGDGRYVFGANNNGDTAKIWMFNATDGTLIGTLDSNSSTDHLLVTNDLMGAFIGPPIHHLNLAPIIEHSYPIPGSLLGYTPQFFSMRLTGGLAYASGENATALVNDTELSFRYYSSGGTSFVYRADFNVTLEEGLHNYSICFPWLEGVIWKNSTFTIDRKSPASLRPMLSRNEPPNQSIQQVGPTDIGVDIIYANDDWVVQGGWILLDGVNLTATYDPRGLSATHDGLGPGWHNVSACVYWDNGLGKAWSNWSFLAMLGPALAPVYPADGEVLTQMPKYIEVAIDLGDTGGFIASPQLYVDSRPFSTSLTTNGTMLAHLPSIIKGGTHSAMATIDWAGGRTTLTWQFELDMFVGPRNELLEEHRYQNEFSLLVPIGSTWTLIEDSEIAGVIYPLAMYGPTIGNFRTNILVQRIEDGEVEESESYLRTLLDKSLEELGESGFNATIVGNPVMRLVDNCTAYVATIQLIGYSVYQRFALIASEEHGLIWIVILSINLTEFDPYSDMFDQMVDSFKVEIKAEREWDMPELATIGLGIAGLTGASMGVALWLSMRRKGKRSAPPQ